MSGTDLHSDPAASASGGDLEVSSSATHTQTAAREEPYRGQSRKCQNPRDQLSGPCTPTPRRPLRLVRKEAGGKSRLADNSLIQGNYLQDDNASFFWLRRAARMKAGDLSHLTSGVVFTSALRRSLPVPGGMSWCRPFRKGRRRPSVIEPVNSGGEPPTLMVIHHAAWNGIPSRRFCFGRHGKDGSGGHGG